MVEVLFKKFASPKGDPAAICNSFRFVGIMGVHSLLWMWWVWFHCVKVGMVTVCIHRVPLIVLHFTSIEPFELPSIRECVCVIHRLHYLSHSIPPSFLQSSFSLLSPNLISLSFVPLSHLPPLPLSHPLYQLC